MDKLKNIRELRGLTQQDLANKVGLSRNTIVNFESGKRLPRVDDLVRIAKVLKVDPTVFFPIPTSPVQKEEVP